MKYPLWAVCSGLSLVMMGGLTLPVIGVEPSWKTQVVGIMVTAPEGATDHRSFCWKSGVTVSTILTPPAGKIIQIKDFESKIDSFTDDKGTDLMAAPDTKDPFNKPGLSVQLPSSDVGYPSVIADLKALGHPAKDATMLKITGKMVAQVASDSQQVTVDNAEIKPKTAFKVGEMSLTISDASMKKGFSQKEEFMVTFSSGKNLESISKIEFFDAQGNKIEANKRSWGGGLGRYTMEYALKTSVDHAKIVVSYWTDLKTVEVPIDIKTSVGL